MTEMTIRRLGVFSVAKIQGLLMFVMGLIFGIIYGLFFMIFGAAMSALAPQSEGQLGGLGTIVLGIVMMVGIPIFYGFIGFIGGAIGALIYNAAAKVVGGIKLELEGTAPPAYAPPPPAQQWAGQYRAGQ